MKNIPLFKKISILTVSALMISVVAPLTSFANSDEEKEPVLENVLASEEVDGISTDVELDDDVLSQDFDLEEEVKNMPSVDEMTKDEKELFDQIVEEQTELSGINDKKTFEESLTDFFDKKSDTYNDLTAAQDNLVEKIDESSVVDNDEDQLAFMKNAFTDTFGVKEAQAVKIGIPVRFAGAVFNTVIGFAVGGGVGAIQSFIIHKGKQAAQRVFTRTVVSRLKAWGAVKLAVTVGVCVNVALNYLDLGTQIAKQLDKRDRRPNNGWVDIY